MEYILPKDKELTTKKLQEFINKYQKEITNRYIKLEEAYRTDYSIFRLPKKEEWKPDNRIAVNFARYIVDTMNGFFIGVPIKTVCDDENISAYVERFEQYNGVDDNNAELSKICSIFGKGYEMYYVDDSGQIALTHLSPLEAFMITDDGIIKRPRYFVRVYKDTENVLRGSISDDTTVRYFVNSSGLKYTGDEKLHGFAYVPATEYKDNEETIGMFEPVLSMINAYNKAISEKANDVDYFADAYMKVLGAKLDEESMTALRANRIINFEGNEAEKMVVDFLQKPNADTTQENLINRLEKLIYQISMVANISDENFGTSSGIALKYKLLAMSNLAKTKERKFTAGMQRRYKVIFSNPLSGMRADDWAKLSFQFTQNFPANLLEESQIAGNLAGITSQQTQLKVLSIVDNVKQEMEQKEKEMDSLSFETDYPTNRIAEATL